MRGKNRDARTETYFVVICVSCDSRKPTSSFFNQRSAIDIGLQNQESRNEKQENGRLVSRLLPLGSQLFSYHIQRSSSHLTRFPDFDCPEVSSHWELLSIEGSIPSLVGRFGVEQARTHIIIHRDACPLVKADTRYAPAVVDSISIGREAIVNNQGGKFET